MNASEIAAFGAGDPAVFKFVTESCRAADARDALGIEGYGAGGGEYRWTGYGEYCGV